jgi:hypothetical protein
MAEHNLDLGHEPSQGMPFATLHARGVMVILAATTVLAALTASECHNYLMSRLGGISVIPSLVFGMVMWLWWGGIAAGLW